MAECREACIDPPNISVDDGGGVSHYSESLNQHYAPTNIAARILERLQQACKDLDALSRDDLAAFDEFHGGGRESTRALARLAGLTPGARVLDIGSGVGGPARTLAAEFGCNVTGIDITAEYCRAAQMLTDRTGLNAQVAFQCGNALDMPFEDAMFDVVWSQNTMMNMEDKVSLFKQVRRVLRPGGVFAFEVVLAGQAAGPHYPTFWANSSSLSFLIAAEEMRAMLASAGLRERIWEDTTQRTLANQKKRKQALAKEAMPVLGLGVIVAADLEAKMENGMLNNEQGRICTVEAVYTN